MPLSARDAEGALTHNNNSNSRCFILFGCSWRLVTKEVFWLVATAVDDDFLKHDSRVERLDVQRVFSGVGSHGDNLFHDSFRDGGIIYAVNIFRVLVQVFIEVDRHRLLVIECDAVAQSAFVQEVECGFDHHTHVFYLRVGIEQIDQLSPVNGFRVRHERDAAQCATQSRDDRPLSLGRIILPIVVFRLDGHHATLFFKEAEEALFSRFTCGMISLGPKSSFQLR